ncbi:MAG TPA: sterol desaturase family protein, partial [Pseudomonadales bacterium]|nr:sterol desaturase family protein [Pseudomonadales bacterium]
AAVFGYVFLHSQYHHEVTIAWWVVLLEVLAVLLFRDVFIYIKHRIFHAREYWIFHSIHHGSEELNWLSAARFHPFEMFVETGGEFVVFIACSIAGFDFAAISLAVFIIGFWDFFIHSNLRWTFGPLRYFIVSPVQHRWHHSDAPEAIDKNFAAMFSCIDVAFGTFYMPDHIMPTTTGLHGEARTNHPRSFIGQFMLPFKPRAKRRLDAVPQSQNSSVDAGH